MNEKTLKEIDYFRIREEVAGFCLSEEGKKSLLERNPLTKLQEIEYLKNLFEFVFLIVLLSILASIASVLYFS